MRQHEVIIPVRNGGQALVNSIQSVLPSLKSGRVLLTISDNFSTDGSPWKQLLQSLPQDQWRLISPPESLGRVEHWSWAFAQGRCPWIKPLMTGDRIDDAFWDWADVAKVQFPQAGMLFCAATTIDPDRAHPEIIRKSSASESTQLYDSKQFSDDALRCLNLVGALSQMLVRADVMKKALPFEPAFAWTADWRMFADASSKCPLPKHARGWFVWIAALRASAHHGKDCAAAFARSGGSRLNRHLSLEHPRPVRFSNAAKPSEQKLF